jgi:heterodisulfide reductase subunit A
MAVARARNLEPLYEFDLPVNKIALVVEEAGRYDQCSEYSQTRHGVELVEKDSDLGGMLRKSITPWKLGCSRILANLAREVYQHPLIHINTDATIVESKVMWEIS